MNNDNFLVETQFLDYNSKEIQNYLKNVPTYLDQIELAKYLYFMVRDGFLYDPFHLDLRQSALKSSVISSQKRAWCVEKSILLASISRFFSIPSRLGFAIVKNHVGVEKLITYLQKDEIVFHGYVELFLNGKWVKCTPAFDKRICRISKVSPLDWDGKTDSLFQEFENNQKYMEYIHFYGTFDDVPIDLMNSEMKRHYPHLFDKEWNTKEFSFFHK
jgi:transglutaminase-like putative cysteine protease